MKADPEGVSLEDDQDADVVLEGTLVCALTGEHKTASPQEETLQSFIEQLHREYGVELADMERDVRVECITRRGGRQGQEEDAGRVQLAVYEHGKPHEVENIIRAVLVAKPGTKADQRPSGCSKRCSAASLPNEIESSGSGPTAPT